MEPKGVVEFGVGGAVLGVVQISLEFEFCRLIFVCIVAELNFLSDKGRIFCSIWSSFSIFLLKVLGCKPRTPKQIDFIGRDRRFLVIFQLVLVILELCRRHLNPFLRLLNCWSLYRGHDSTGRLGGLGAGAEFVVVATITVENWLTVRVAREFCDLFLGGLV